MEGRRGSDRLCGPPAFARAAPARQHQPLWFRRHCSAQAETPQSTDLAQTSAGFSWIPCRANSFQSLSHSDTKRKKSRLLVEAAFCFQTVDFQALVLPSPCQATPFRPVFVSSIMRLTSTVRGTMLRFTTSVYCFISSFYLKTFLTPQSLSRARRMVKWHIAQFSRCIFVADRPNRRRITSSKSP